MPIDKNPECIYECNKGIECENYDCTVCEHNPKNEAIPENDEIVLIDRMTGKRQTCNINDLCRLIKTVFPDKEEQKELLREMFRNSFE